MLEIVSVCDYTQIDWQRVAIWASSNLNTQAQMVTDMKQAGVVALPGSEIMRRRQSLTHSGPITPNFLSGYSHGIA